jgi:hypothetical protein
MTRDDLEKDEVFSAAVDGLPKVVELITAAPEEKRSLALAAAHQAYRKRGCARSSAPTRATANCDLAIQRSSASANDLPSIVAIAVAESFGFS